MVRAHLRWWPPRHPPVPRRCRHPSRRPPTLGPPTPLAIPHRVAPPDRNTIGTQWVGHQRCLLMSRSMTLWISRPALWTVMCTTCESPATPPEIPARTSENVVRRVWTKNSWPRFAWIGVSRVSRETGGSADGHNAPEPVRLRHVDAGEWRYGRGEDDTPW